MPTRIEFDEVPGASPVKHNVDAFLDHSDDYKLDDVEAQLHKIHKEFIQFKEWLLLILSIAALRWSDFINGEGQTVRCVGGLLCMTFFSRRTTANSWNVEMLLSRNAT